MLLEGLLIGHLFLFQIRTVSKLFIGVFSFVDGEHLVVMFRHFDPIVEIPQEYHLATLIFFYHLTHYATDCLVSRRGFGLVGS
jgi:hypothetical protein